ncbi:rhomboid superfamily protein [Emydomyces testavorans]|uniref:Rhomboid superfamily protein n=1 Tax=Emydomyces testavorans TaxID=2070801 RepID=A0AAF0DCB5_9EURO|nr:rhomboid superfamily protein [Emydomyces testavorans]
MNNAFSIAWRGPCVEVRSLLQPGSSSTVRSFVRSFCLDRGTVRTSHIEAALNLNDTFFRRQSLKTCRKNSPPFSPPRRSSYRSFSTSPLLKAQSGSSNNRKPREEGVSFQPHELSHSQISRIFGTPRIPPAFGNRILRVLHGRRVAGTLDLELPPDITKAVPQHVLDDGLKWLRQNFPYDEDAAIISRIEREEQEEEERLIRRAEELGLYKPQSGRFGAEVEKEGDIYGRSAFQEIRKENEKLNKQREEEERREWLESEAKEKENLKRSMQRNTELSKFEGSAIAETRPRADPNQRPALAWIQKHHLRATSTNIDTSKMNKPRRILPSLAVAILTAGLCYIYAETYQPPAREHRILPMFPPAAATAIGLIGVNVTIFLMWKAFPPSWRLLNKYFISVPLYPYAFSTLGSVFSHQQIRHLGANMFILWFIGTRLHDEVGRGKFLALYLSSGALASFTSLTAHVLGNNLTITSLGASGAIAGLVAAWCMLHSNDKLTIAFLPRDWQEIFSANGSTFLAVIVIVEFLTLALPFRIAAMDHWSHLGGYATGALVGWLWKEKRERERKKNVWHRFLDGHW